MKYCHQSIKWIIHILLLFSVILLFSCEREGSTQSGEVKTEKSPAEELTPAPMTIEDMKEKFKVPAKAREIVSALLKGGKEDPSGWVKTANGVLYYDIHKGRGKVPENGVAVYLHIRGYLEDGTQVLNTFKRREYFIFTYGKGQVIKGLEEGIATMREGGKRVIVIPPELAYGSEGYESSDSYVPPDSALIFEVSFLWIRAPEWDKLNKFE